MYNFIDFDKQIQKDSSIEDVDREAIDSYLEVLCDDKIRELFDKLDLDEFLQHIGAGEFVDGVFRLNNAGVLFFSNPARFDFSCKILMAKFKGPERLDIVDKHFTTSSFFKLLKEFNDFVYRNIEVYCIDGKLMSEYPIEALKRAFINAFVHRNYNSRGSYTTFYIYSDRVAIVNPDNSAYPLVIRDLESGDNLYHKNKNMYNIFKTTKYATSTESGIDYIKRLVKNHKLSEVEFKLDYYFTVIFKKTFNASGDISDLNLNKRQINALFKMINDNEKFSYNSYLECFNVSKSTARRDLNELADKKFVKKLIKNHRCYFYV